MALYFNHNLLDLDDEQVLDYLHLCKSQHDTPSESFFKHTVYGLRYAYRIFGLPEKNVVLPSIERPKDLPVVLSTEEIKILLKTPKLLKHRLILAYLYGCGLRCFELRNIEIQDLNFYRNTLHVKKGKYRKDRYVPLCPMLIRGTRKYLSAENPVKWLFNGNSSDGKHVPLSQRGVQWAVREARKHSGINKDLTSHTLRHSYATHLLEMGTDIMTVRDLLGHKDIQTTLIYLHVARVKKKNSFSPLAKLYPDQ